MLVSICIYRSMKAVSYICPIADSSAWPSKHRSTVTAKVEVLGQKYNGHGKKIKAQQLSDGRPWRKSIQSRTFTVSCIVAEVIGATSSEGFQTGGCRSLGRLCEA